MPVDPLDRCPRSAVRLPLAHEPQSGRLDCAARPRTAHRIRTHLWWQRRAHVLSSSCAPRAVSRGAENAAAAALRRRRRRSPCRSRAAETQESEW